MTLTIENYTSHRQKTTRLREYLKTANPDELILFTDGYDTILLAGESEILAKYHRLSPTGKILMSADRINASGPQYPELFKPTLHSYNYLCSGGFIGKAGAILEAIDVITEVIRNDHSGENKDYRWCDQY